MIDVVLSSRPSPSANSYSCLLCHFRCCATFASPFFLYILSLRAFFLLPLHLCLIILLHLTLCAYYQQAEKSTQLITPKRMTNSDTVPEPEMPRPQPKNLQSLRAVYKNSLSAPTPRSSITGTNALLAESEIVHIDCFTEQATGRKVFLWECVLLAFEDALHVRHNSRILPFLRDCDDQL